MLHRIADPSAGVRESGVGRLRPTRVGILEFEVNAAESFAGFAVEMGHPARVLALPAPGPKTDLSLRSHPSSFGQVFADDELVVAAVAETHILENLEFRFHNDVGLTGPEAVSHGSHDLV